MCPLSWPIHTPIASAEWSLSRFLPTGHKSVYGHALQVQKNTSVVWSQEAQEENFSKPYLLLTCDMPLLVAVTLQQWEMKEVGSDSAKEKSVCLFHLQHEKVTYLLFVALLEQCSLLSHNSYQLCQTLMKHILLVNLKSCPRLDIDHILEWSVVDSGTTEQIILSDLPFHCSVFSYDTCCILHILWMPRQHLAVC